MARSGKRKQAHRTRAHSISTSSDVSQGGGSQAVAKRAHQSQRQPAGSSSSRSPSPSSRPATSGNSLAPATPSRAATQQPSVRIPDPALPSTSDFTTPNPFNVLDNDITVSDNKSTKPPPIFIKGVTDFPKLAKDLHQITGPKEFICKARTEDIAVFPISPDAYRKIVHFLRQSGAKFHTYQLKEEKTFRIVIRHIHPSTPPETIIEGLNELGFKTRQVTNVHHPVTKIPLALFFVDLEPADSNKDIFNLTELCFFKIKVEEPHKKREIVQCKKCQQYLHTRGYCYHQVKCSRCAGDHQTSECKKPKDVPPKCVNCQGSHPANYRGCVVHKELQNRRKNVQSQNIATTTHPHSTLPPADLLTGPPLPPSRPPRFKEINQLDAVSSLGQPASQLHLQEHQHLLPPPPISYAAAASCNSLPRNHCHPISSPNSSVNDLTSILSSFLTDLKSTIAPLISLLTNVLTSLVPALANLK